MEKHFFFVSTLYSLGNQVTYLYTYPCFNGWRWLARKYSRIITHNSTVITWTQNFSHKTEWFSEKTWINMTWNDINKMTKWINIEYWSKWHKITNRVSWFLFFFSWPSSELVQVTLEVVLQPAAILPLKLLLQRLPPRRGDVISFFDTWENDGVDWNAKTRIKFIDWRKKCKQIAPAYVKQEPTSKKTKVSQHGR